MQKVYLLLRNNRQLGPFNVDELLQHDLKSNDLIWEEGKSAGWSYPNEIESLRSFFHKEVPVKIEKENIPATTSSPHSYLVSDMDAPFASKQVTSKNVYVSLPANGVHKEESKPDTLEETLEQKAEAIRKRAFAAKENVKESRAVQSEQVVSDKNYDLETKLSRSTSEIGEDYSAWLYTRQIEKKKKARKRRGFLMGISTVLMLALGFWLFKTGVTESGPGNNSTKMLRESNNDVVQSENVQPRYMNEISTNESVAGVPENTGDADIPVERKEKLVAKSKSPALKEEIGNERFGESNANKVDKPAASSVSDEVNTGNETADVTAAPKKKETLGQKIGGFFERLKTKDIKQPASETKQDQASTGGVKSKPEQAAAPPVNIANHLSVSSNAPSENWMMGVQGLKLTLHNKSNETVKTASVEVRYYNEQNDLLEKKVVYFTNVSPKSTQTVSAPNHRLADHADYQLITASAKEDGYVKQ